jgi:hypothetical protein
VVRVSGYSCRYPGSIPGTYIFSEKGWVRNEVHSVSTTEELLKRKKAVSV